ncbi:MAG: hypothetical protein AAF311_15500 [Pseudomonadota bacterium]
MTVPVSDKAPSENGSPAPTTLEDWTALLALPCDGMWRRIRAWTYSASSPRMRTARVPDLMTGKGAVALDAFLAARSRARVKALRTYAIVNQEQAAAALRMTTIANVSVPAVFITAASQISSGSIWNDLWRFYTRDPDAAVALAILSGVSLLVLAWLLAYSATRMGQARDLRHRIDLHAAGRGIYFGLEDEGGTAW